MFAGTALQCFLLLGMPVLFLSLPVGEFVGNKHLGPKRPADDRRTWFERRWSLPVSVASFCSQRRLQLGLDAPSWRHHNATVAVALTGEFDVVSSRGFLQQAEQRQWADYICLKDNAVLRHIFWAQVQSVVVLQSPCPHTLKDRRWTAFSSVRQFPKKTSTAFLARL